jgi:rhodanese-related sulfurtransferase
MAERQTVDHLLAASRARIERLDPQAAQAAMRAGAMLVDTRCAEQRRETGVIPGSVHLPLSVLLWRLDPASGSADPALADPSRRVILMCAHGYSSSIAAATLRDLGFARSADVDGGFEAWRAAGLPIEAAPD